MSGKLNVNRVRDLLQDFAFHDLFIEELGWLQPAQKRAAIVSVGDKQFTYKGLALLGGIEAFEVTSASGDIPDRSTQTAISKELSKVRLEHVLIFVDSKRTQSVWFWVKRDGSKRLPREHHFFKGQPGDLFISKIASMSVDLSELDDSGQLPLLDAAKKVQRALDIETVIKKFFKDYDEQRVQFTELIKGIPDDRDRRWYASVLLNRMMFIYFLQRKLFIDGGDEFYLENKLGESKKRGQNRYYSEFLQALFFEAFAKPEEKRSAEAKQLTGKVKYLNGGLFLPHKLEQRHTIDVPDEAFDGLFKLFGRYSWSLNDIPGESDDDINPDVLGYIFEKYINQKEFGAYYTRPEITEYLCEQTIYRLILDRACEPNIEGLPPGRQFESVPELLVRLDKLTARKLLHDILPDLTILDPAVGSGAFLVAALKTLITVYSAVVGWLQFHDDVWLEEHLRSKMKTDLGKVHYAIKKAIITDNLYGVDLMEEATEIAKLRLFMTLVASAHSVDDLEPLPNIDFNILAGNSLIGLMRVEDAEFEEVQRNKDKTASLFAPTKTYRQILTEKNLKVDQYRYASGYSDDLGYLRAQVEQIEEEARPVLQDLLQQSFEDLGIKFQQATWNATTNTEGKPISRALTAEDMNELEPFHWGFEFDRILNLKGGFDAIITNPPWETFQPDAKAFFTEYSDLVTKKTMRITDFKEELERLLSDPDIKTAWLKYQSKFNHTRSYYRVAPLYVNQVPIIDGRRHGKDVNLYKLFLERCFHLLKKGGECGIVIPSGIYTDLGSKSLRDLLFEQSQITGLICFENRKAIFEGVHRSFKFVVLSFQKGSYTTSFPAAFMRHEVSDLQRFPSSIGVCLSVAGIKRLAPDSHSLMEFKSEMDATIAEKLVAYPLLSETTAVGWAPILHREFNMTDDSDLFQTSSSNNCLPLFEGKMMWQFEYQLATPRYWIDRRAGRERLLGRNADQGQLLGYEKFRLAYRSVASNTNERSMIATIIPPSFTGNSLNVSENLDAPTNLFLVALFDSFTLDWMMRLKVTTNINMFYVYQLPVPRLTKVDESFLKIVRRAARLICTTVDYSPLWNEVDQAIGLDPSNPTPKTGACPWTHDIAATTPHEREQLKAELDGLVAHLYRLTEEQFNHILATFPIVKEPVILRARTAYRDIANGVIQ